MQLESLPTLVAGIWTDENTLQLEATTQFRKLLSIGKTFYLVYIFGFSNVCFDDDYW